MFHEVSVSGMVVNNRFSRQHDEERRQSVVFCSVSHNLARPCNNIVCFQLVQVLRYRFVSQVQDFNEQLFLVREMMEKSRLGQVDALC